MTVPGGGSIVDTKLKKLNTAKKQEFFPASYTTSVVSFSDSGVSSL